MAADKERPPSNTIDLLGAQIVLSQSFVEASLPSHRRETLSKGIRQILPDNRLSPAEAAKWRGELGFAQSLLFGRMGRTVIQPFPHDNTQRIVSLNGFCPSNYAK